MTRKKLKDYKNSELIDVIENNEICSYHHLTRVCSEILRRSIYENSISMFNQIESQIEKSDENTHP